MAIAEKQTIIASARQAIHDLNTRLQEIVTKEMRGIRTSPRQKRYLQQKRDEAHRTLKTALAH